MNPPPTGGSIISTISGPLFVKQLVHGLVRKSEDYVTFLNTFVLVPKNQGKDIFETEYIARGLKVQICSDERRAEEWLGR